MVKTLKSRKKHYLCPCCRSAKIRVGRTVTHGSVVTRYRYCSNCNYKSVTKETIVKEYHGSEETRFEIENHS